MTADAIPHISASGLSSARHVEALRSATKHFAVDNKLHATLPTGITVEYSLHRAGDAGPESEKWPVERVVMIGGFMQTKEQYTAVLDMLLAKWDAAAQHKRLCVLTFDNRGVGGSDAPIGRYTTSQMAEDTLALMDHVGWETAHVAGASMGGMISIELASVAPKRVESLTLMVTTRGRYHAELRSWKPLLGTIFARSTTQLIANTLELIYPPEFLQQSIDGTHESMLSVLGKYHGSRPANHALPTYPGLIGQAFACQTHFVSDERLKSLSSEGFPILIIGCLEDILIPPAESVKLKQLLGGDHVDTLFFANGGHGVFFQFMEEVADAMTRTFQRSKL